MLTDRQQQILTAVVRHHIETADPVGSQLLASRFGFPFSPATIRSEMHALEDGHYLTQPHWSAGRIPTSKGYRFYVDGIGVRKAGNRETNLLRRALVADEPDLVAREICKTLAQIANVLALFVDDRGDVHYFGLSRLLQLPEFADRERVVALAALLDRTEHLADACAQAGLDESRVVIGDETPLTRDAGCALLVRATGDGATRIAIGILGPQRMPYDRNVALLATALATMSGLPILLILFLPTYG